MSTPQIRLHAALTLAVAITLAGCGMSPGGPSSESTTSPLRAVNGSVHGGQQPVAGAQIALYAAGKTGIASSARSMLTAPVTSNANGNFTITGLFTCQPGDQIYLVATGGDSGGGPNSAIGLMVAIGPCAALLPSTFFNVDEVTTVASVFSLAAYMTGAQNIGSDAANANALAAAFANTQTFVDVATGFALQTSTGNGIVPYATINSLANSISTCINSTSGSAACNNLFNVTTLSGNTPSDTIQATLNVALSPAANPSGVFLQATSAAPFQPTLTSAPATYALSVLHPSDVLTYHNDIARTGVQPYESALTPASVNPTLFGKLYSFAVDSYLFAQPLYVGGVGMPDGAVHNLVFAASTHGTVYAFDADNNNPATGYLWSQNYIPSGERFPAAADYFGCSNPPEAGIVGTPVIDRSTQTLYFVVKSITSTGSTFYHRLHAVSLLDGSERPGSPQIINPTFAGTGNGSSGGTIAFNGQAQNNRGALLLNTSPSGTKTLWITYASHCDTGKYHGLLLGYNTANLTQVSAAFNNTPNGNDGGVWGSSGGPAADAQGNIYLLDGNGTFDANTGGPDYGDTALKLVPPTAGAASNLMTVADFFTPSNQLNLENTDSDLGGAAPILVTDPASGVAPNLLIASDKLGYIYLINTANMGKYETGINGINSLNGDIQDFGGNSGFIYNFAFFNNTLYTGSNMHAYAFVPGTATTSGKFNTNPIASVSGTNGIAPAVSANGAANPVVWTFDQSGNLNAYTASLTPIYSSTTAANGRDTPAPFVKFTSPIIANGKVFLSGQGALTVYGLLP